MCSTLASSSPRSRPASLAVGVVPALEHGLGRPEADGVVHRRGTANAAALEDREVEVLGLLHHAVGVQPADHVDLVVGEGARLDVAAALQHEHVEAVPSPARRRRSPRRRRCRRCRRPSRAARRCPACSTFRSSGLRSLRLVRACAPGSGVADRVVGVGVVVVAGEGELLADPDAGPAAGSSRSAASAAACGSSLEEGAPVVGLELRQRRAAARERGRLHSVQGQPVDPAPARGHLPRGRPRRCRPRARGVIVSGSPVMSTSAIDCRAL